jgi:hypothetical protein
MPYERWGTTTKCCLQVSDTLAHRSNNAQHTLTAAAPVSCRGLLTAAWVAASCCRMTVKNADLL